MASVAKGNVEGLDQVKGALKGVDQRVRKKALRKGVSAATGVILRRAKDKVRVRSKTLKKSLGRKVKVFRGGAVVGIVGPRTGFKTQVGVVKSGPKAGQPIYENPTQIAHLVEKGTHRSRAFPFMAPALEESKADAAAATADAVRDELHR